MDCFSGHRNVRDNTFSERHPEVAKIASFSCKIVNFCPFFVQTARRSFVENDRLPSFEGALDGWYAPRF